MLESVRASVHPRYSDLVLLIHGQRMLSLEKQNAGRPLTQRQVNWSPPFAKVYAGSQIGVFLSRLSISQRIRDGSRP